MWSNVVEETGEPGENHRTWTGDHYPATCLDPDSNPDRLGDKRVRYPLRYPGPALICINIMCQSYSHKEDLGWEKMSRIVRKPDFCLGENKGADQLRGNREADQRLCFLLQG